MTDISKLKLSDLTKGLEKSLGDVALEAAGKGMLPAAVGAMVSKAIYGQVVRPLNAADLIVLANHQSLPRDEADRPHLKTMKDKHHQIARYMAQNMSDAEIAAETGYSIGRIEVLRNDPSLKNLVAKYRHSQTEIVIDLHKKYEATVSDAIDELGDRLTTQPEEFTANQLLDIVERLGDRAGMGPKSHLDVNAKVGILVTDATLASVKEIVNGQSKGRILQGHRKTSEGDGASGSPIGGLSELPKPSEDGEKPLSKERLSLPKPSAAPSGAVAAGTKPVAHDPLAADVV